jgi:protein-S-isoprenylcysteine O-methyltransferase Ste14
MLLAGALIRTWAQRTLGEQYTWEVVVLPNHKLITQASYSIVRHPIYTGSLLAIFGQVLFAFSNGTFFDECLVPTYPYAFMILKGVASVGMGTGFVTIIKRSVIEDEVMKMTFGKEWEDWASKTRYKLIPGVF